MGNCRWRNENTLNNPIKTKVCENKKRLTNSIGSDKHDHTLSSSTSTVEVDTKCEPLLPQPEKSTLVSATFRVLIPFCYTDSVADSMICSSMIKEVLKFNIRWKGILVLALAWFAFLFLQILKVCFLTDSSPLFCSTLL